VSDQHNKAAASGDFRIPAGSPWAQAWKMAAALGVLGLVALVAGWIGTSGTRVISDQLAYIASGGMLGLFLIAFAGAVLLADYMAEQQQANAELRERLTRIERALSGDVPRSDGARNGALAVADGRLVMIPGAERVHRPNCPLVQGKNAVRAVEAEDLRDGRLKGCRTCSPDVAQLASN